MEKIYKNINGRFETESGKVLSCGHPISLNLGSDEEKQWVKGRIEHNGKDYYFYCPSGRNIELKDGDIIKDLW